MVGHMAEFFFSIMQMVAMKTMSKLNVNDVYGALLPLRSNNCFSFSLMTQIKK